MQALQVKLKSYSALETIDGTENSSVIFHFKTVIEHQV